MLLMHERKKSVSSGSVIWYTVLFHQNRTDRPVVLCCPIDLVRGSHTVGESIPSRKRFPWRTPPVSLRILDISVGTALGLASQLLHRLTLFPTGGIATQGVMGRKVRLSQERVEYRIVEWKRNTSPFSGSEGRKRPHFWSLLPSECRLHANQELTKWYFEQHIHLLCGLQHLT